MKKKKGRKNNNNFVMLVTVLILLILVLGISYLGINKLIDDKERKAASPGGSRPTFYSDAKDKKVDLYLPTDSPAAGEILTNAVINVSLQNSEDTTTICNYNLYWQWDDNPNGYYKTKSDNNELTLSGNINGEAIFDEVQIKDYNLANLQTLLAKFYVVNDGGKITNQSWNITAKYYNIGGTNPGKSYRGSLVIDDVNCSEAVYLKDLVLEKDNYVCLGSKAEYCPDESLYYIIGKDANGIKLLAYEYMGTSIWSNELLTSLSDAFMQKRGLNYGFAIKEMPWSTSDSSINSKIGLLTEEEYNNFIYKDNLVKSVLLLGGKVVTPQGIEMPDRAVGYVYPVFYLDDDAVTSRGNGTRENPFYVN